MQRRAQRRPQNPSRAAAETAQKKAPRNAQAAKQFPDHRPVALQQHQQASALGHTSHPLHGTIAAHSNGSPAPIQAVFTGDAAKILDIVCTRDDAPAIIKLLHKNLSEIESEITIGLLSGGKVNFNFSENSINLNAKLITDALAMAREEEAGWEEVLTSLYAQIAHEMRHAFDFNNGKADFVSGVITETSQIWGMYKAELNAWSSESRAYIERGALDDPLVLGWIGFDPTNVDMDNLIWARLAQYTDGAFQSNFPEGWRGDTWEKKMQARVVGNDELLGYITGLQEKVTARYAKASESD